MSYSPADFADSVAAMLAADGYELAHGNGYSTAAVGVELPEVDAQHHAPDDSLRGFWFTWAADGTDIECGETVETELQAWACALAHRLANSRIPTHAA